MKCKACNKTLSQGEQTLDNRTGELNDMCNECINAAMLEHEFDIIKTAIDMTAFLNKEEVTNEEGV